MTILTIALLQVRAAGHDQATNLARGEAACRRAAAEGADIALFPEMWNTGYVFAQAGGGARSVAGSPGSDLQRWRAQAVPHDGPFVRRFAALAAELHMAVAITYLEDWPEAPRNSVTLFDRRGREALTYAKVHTCAFDEPEASLTPGDGFPVADLDTAAGAVRVGAMICYDREFPEAARVLALKGAELVLVPNACELEQNRLGQLRARSFENMTVMALANYPAPQQNGHSVCYHPMAFDEQGASRETTLAEAGESETIVYARLDLDELREWREREVWGPMFRRPGTYGPLTDPRPTDAPY